MIPYERRQILLNELEKQDMVTLSDFARALHGVSESTIRRDLKILEGEGQIVLLRGGAAKIKTGSYDTPIHSRGLYKIKEKEAIARTAAKLVHDGEVIYIDSGTTCLKMISYLKNKRITVVTTNAMVVPSILETDIHVIMIGGDVLKSTASIVGSITDNSLKDMFFDKAFIGATGYDLQSGINTPDSREANKKRIIKENSSEVYVLADSSKSGKRTMCKAMELSECTIITEQETELLKEHANYIKILGMDIGGTNLRMGLVDETLSVSGLEVIPARQVYRSDNTPEALSAVIEGYINRHPDSGRPPMIAAGFPSVVDKSRRRLYSSTNFPGLDGVDMVGFL